MKTLEVVSNLIRDLVATPFLLVSALLDGIAFSIASDHMRHIKFENNIKRFVIIRKKAEELGEIEMFNKVVKQLSEEE